MIELLDYLLFLCIPYSVFAFCSLIHLSSVQPGIGLLGQVLQTVKEPNWKFSSVEQVVSPQHQIIQLHLCHCIKEPILLIFGKVCHQHSIECETLYNMNKLRLVDLIYLSSSHSASAKKRGYIEKELFSSAS